LTANTPVIALSGVELALITTVIGRTLTYPDNLEILKSI
jgi:hypothetical protein